jgi:hypothetical protein
MRDSKHVGDYLGNIASGFEPQIVKQVAKGMDDKVLPRKPEGFVQRMEVGIPGLRQNVPLRTLKGMTLDQKFDYYDKMTPKQREDSDISDSINISARHLGSRLTPEQIQRLQAMGQ